MALIDSARVVAAGPDTLIPPLGASSPGLGAPIPEPAPFPAPHRFWFPRRHPEVVVRRRVRPTSALSRPIARGRGSTGRGLCVLHEGPTYLEYPRPSSSRSPPSCSGRWRHQITGSNGNQDRPTRRTSGLGCQGCPARRSGRGHPARWGTGLLSPTASNDPGWKDTHPAARNVPVVGRGASVTDLGVGCQREVRRDGDSGVRPHAPGRPRPGPMLIVTTRPHRKDVAGVPGQESLGRQSPERRAPLELNAMASQALSRRCSPRRQDWGYPVAGCRHLRRPYRWRP